jgi:hypothetical protein
LPHRVLDGQISSSTAADNMEPALRIHARESAAAESLFEFG